MASFGQMGDWSEARRVRDGESFLPEKAQRRTDARLASGSFASPECDVPLALTEPLPLKGNIRCPFCRSIGSVGSFFHEDTFDTPLNTVELRARLPR